MAVFWLSCLGLAINLTVDLLAQLIVGCKHIDGPGDLGHAAPAVLPPSLMVPSLTPPVGRWSSSVTSSARCQMAGSCHWGSTGRSSTGTRPCGRRGRSAMGLGASWAATCKFEAVHLMRLTISTCVLLPAVLHCVMHPSAPLLCKLDKAKCTHRT